MTEEENKIRGEQEELFKKLVQLNVNDHTENKDGLTYLSWSWAWQEFKKACPDATYEVKKFESNGKTYPYLEDEKFGIMVFTEITARGVTHEMWLPVMDGKNKAMKSVSYTYSTKSGERTVEAATMFDINKTIMRCLTKNIAMFGLGLYIYAGEDLPIEFGDPCTPQQVAKMKELAVNETNIRIKYKVTKLEELTYQQAEFIIVTKEKALKEKALKGE